MISHLEALRTMLLKCVIATAVLYPVAYFITPEVISMLVRWSFPDNIGKLHYFAPMEVFWVQLKLGLILAMIMAYPWNIRQIWRFLLPALYQDERRALGWWIFLSSLLFFIGIVFSICLVLPLLMNFSGDFATPELQAVLGLANFLELAGLLMFAFGIMFQSPMIVLLVVRFNLVSREALVKKRPYIMAAILIIAAILTPPDVISQLLLAVPTWILFEFGLLLAKKIEKQKIRAHNEEDATLLPNMNN